MIIDFPALQSINDNVSLAYNTQFEGTESVYAKFTKEVSSVGRATLYPRLDLLKGMREWVGDRQVQSLSQTPFQIVNKHFESTISIQRTDIADDLLNILADGASQLGKNAKRLPDLLISALMKVGHTTPCFDNQNFFDTAHASFDANGIAATASNYATDGSGTPPWYLLCTTEVAQPLIYQLRQPFVVIPKFSMNDPQVFYNKEFEWGVDGRCNVGFGLWQLAFMSTQALTHDNIKAGIVAMESYRRPDGSPMGITPNMLVTGTQNFFLANALAKDEFQPTTLAASALVTNQVRGLFEPVKNKYLN